MFLSPSDAREVVLPVRRGRYDQAQVDRILDEIVSSYEHVWDEREGLRARVQKLELEFQTIRELERDLRDGLVTAHRAAANVRAEAENERRRLLEEAQRAAEQIRRERQAEVMQLQAEIERLEALEAELQSNFRALLLAALDLLENGSSAAPAREGSGVGEPVRS